DDRCYDIGGQITEANKLVQMARGIMRDHRLRDIVDQMISCCKGMRDEPEQDGISLARCRTLIWSDGEFTFDAFAARDHLIHNIPQPMVSHYSTRHLNQLVRLSYLAPDIITAIINGTQPPQLTGRQIMRKNNIPLDWTSQRIMFGFA
ncbi:MAG: hypothetical protein RIC10_02375, partial [Parasphingorhabdus sp.]